MNLPASTFLSVVIALSPAALLQSEEVDYARDIKPILQGRCYACHGALKQESGLRLDTVQLMLQGGDSGPVVAPANPAESLILERIMASDIAQRMPPEHEGEPFTASQTELLRQWIADGAVGPADEEPESDPSSHWAFQRPVRPAIPQVQNSAWVRNPIDAFIARSHEQHQLVPQTEADRRLLVRRLYLDLIGVPPSPEELASLDADPSSDWYERRVNTLLDDPRYGQRWARHWMDVWRYSDWWGLGDQLRNSQKHIWHWRDWIVQSLNADMPYDEMIRLMLAADELHPGDLDKLRASGYLARNYFLFNRNQWMDETVEHVGKSFLGLTMNCAKCHDHKFDPIAQSDYYAMRAFFEPYHVRVDAVPGQVDLAVDGIPRAFDAQLDTPTYLFVRGQEGSPDKSKPIAPGVPSLLAPDGLTIEPVSLPAEAWQPERRPWVIEAHLAASEQKVASAERAAHAAEEKLATIQAKIEKLAAEKVAAAQTDAVQTDAAQAADGEGQVGAAVSAAGNVAPSALDNAPAPAERFKETFETLDSQRWQAFGGQWVYHPGRVEQRRDGASRAALRWLGKMPRDFDASVRFTIVGGSQWRSVCLAFDATQADAGQDPTPGSSEQVVYVSAVAGGSKVQASYNVNGQWHYPEGGRQERPIELNHQYTLRVQVRGTLVNVSLDADPVLAWRTPVERRDGALQLTTFDALAHFHAFSIAPLAADAKLRDPDSPSQASELELAQAEWNVAKAAAAAAHAEHHATQLRIEAMQRSWATADARGDADKAELEKAEHQAARNAVLAQRDHAIAEAKHAVAAAELKKISESGKKQIAAENDFKAAQDRLSKAVEQRDEPGEEYAPLVGASWSATRFLDSTKDDPAVAFPATSSGRRTALAKWIASPDNPLTARVAANQIWMRHMGTPLVATVFDFGRKGTPPTHPELLDWLACELVDSGWSMKHLHRLITTSSVYRLGSSTAGAEANLARDPDNTYWWRRMPIRIEAEVVRDSVLSLAGTLDEWAGGIPVPPGEQATSPRRSLYFFHSNNERNLFLTTFDEAMVKDCYRREQSIVPQQALALTNSRLVLEAAPQIAQRLSRAAASAPAGQADDAAFVRLAFHALLGMRPNAGEEAACVKSLARWREQAELSAQREAKDATDEAATKDAQAVDPRAKLIWALLNHNDFVTVR